jgi:hypothetical protein
MAKKFNIILDRETYKLQLAANELTRFLGMTENKNEKSDSVTIQIGTEDLQKKPGSFSIESNKSLIKIAAQDEDGALYAAYDLLERLGYGFYPDRDTVPETIDWNVINGLNLLSEPTLNKRGMFVIPWFDDLSMYGIYWDYDKWEQLIDWMVKQKMNLLRLHIFASMGFFPLKKYANTRPFGRESEKKVAMLQRVIQRAQERGIEVSISFYPNSVTREFSENYPNTSYNAWYSYFACLDTEVGWDYSLTTVKEMIEVYKPDYIELVTTEVHCPYCGWDKFSQDQIQLFKELVQYIVAHDTKVALFPFVFPVGYKKLVELLEAPTDTILYTETSEVENTESYLAGGHYIACFEENSTPFMRFKIEEVGSYAKRYAEKGEALTYYLTGFTTKNFEITATAAGKQFWNPYDFDKETYLRTAVHQRLASIETREGKLIAKSLSKFESAWQALESITLSNGERVFGLMPSVANSNYSMFLSTYAPLILEQTEGIQVAADLALEAIQLLQSAKSMMAYSPEIEQLELNQNLFYYNYLALLQISKAFVSHRTVQEYYRTDLWGKHKAAEVLSEEAYEWMTRSVKSLAELIHWVEKDTDYQDMETYYHPYQEPGASIYHTHSGFTLNVMKHRLVSANALLDEIRATRDKLILERTFQGPHRPFVIPNIFKK